ncbi:MAG: GntR family transcriptional regulator [Actinomycetota bacterium]|nr:GntR family transcriptional regulator [Actinomycetota bacterium]
MQTHLEAVVDIVERASELVGERKRERHSAAEGAAAALRDLIMEGRLAPGSRVSEEAFMGPLEVSRNTLREAFRLLTHEKLLVHKLNRGVFVRTLEVGDVTDLFRVRRIVEGDAVTRANEAGIDRMAAAVEFGEKAAKEGRWVDVGTANIRFHQAVAALAGSPRIDELMRQVAAELRLGFHAVGDPRRLHESYLPRNRAIVKWLRNGQIGEARGALLSDLKDAENQMVAAIKNVPVPD